MQVIEQESDWSVGRRVKRILTGAQLVVPLAALGLGLLLVLLVVLAMAVGLGNVGALQIVLVLGATTSLLAFVLALVRLRSQLIEPLARLEDSVAKVCSGEPGATLSLHDTGVLDPMVNDLDSLNEELSELYEDMDSRVSRHTTRLAQKTASLKILYDVAASINQAQDLEAAAAAFSARAEGDGQRRRGDRAAGAAGRHPARGRVDRRQQRGVARARDVAARAVRLRQGAVAR